MMDGTFVIFKGAAQGQQGQGRDRRAARRIKQTDVELEKMNYLVEGVVGKTH